MAELTALRSDLLLRSLDIEVRVTRWRVWPGELPDLKSMVAMLASLLPARRAALTEPMTALRQE